MYLLKTNACFDSAHFLSGYDGKCSNIHGHRWVVEAEISSEELISSGDKRGMVLDFKDLKCALKSIADEFDHALIYERGSLKPETIQALNAEHFHIIEVPYRPTAENLARDFFERLRVQGLPISRVAVYETPDNCAVYEERQ